MKIYLLISGLSAFSFNKRNLNATWYTTTSDIAIETTTVQDVNTTTVVNVEETIVATVLANETVLTTSGVDIALPTTTVIVEATVTALAEPTVVINNEQNFCESVGLGDSIIRGEQSLNVSCSLTVFGVLPDFDHMVSTIITEPANNAIIPLGTNFTVSVFSINMDFGFFDDPNSQYYLSPQTINSAGEIQGHTHITIQKLADPNSPPDARTPVFFRGLNDPSPDGTLSVQIDGDTFNVDGAGEYRICTITASRSHAPVLLPVARRGTADDCIRINIV